MNDASGPGPRGPVLRLTAAWVAAVVAGTLTGDGDREFAGVSIDSRTVAAGDLFVAIRGERFDGAAFVTAALERGAGGAIVPAGWRATARAIDRPIVEVDDTTAALQALAHAIRRESGTKVVAITGSAGKTTTKEVTSELLAARYRVIRNRGNFNNHIGLPLSLVELRERPEIAVVELGMNHAGEISTLVRVADPEVRVWTNVGEAHVGFFASVDAIADAKAEILEGAQPSTLLVANADDHRVMARTAGFGGRVTTFGVDHDADVHATAVDDRGVEGTKARVRTRRGDVDVTIPLIGRGNLLNVLAAMAVAVELDVPLDAIPERLARLSPPPHRGAVLKLASGATVLDDSYNANPTATRRALEVIARTPARRRIAILGEMLELGDHAVALHEDVGRAAQREGVDVLMAVGGAPAAALARAAVAAGMPPASVRHVATSDEAAAWAAGEIRTGDLVLVKGSRGVKTDRVVERLAAEHR